MTKELLRWEDSPGLGKSIFCRKFCYTTVADPPFPEHHCPKCQTPLNNPRAKHTCYFKHVEICPLFHQHFFMIGKSIIPPTHDLIQRHILFPSAHGASGALGEIVHKAEQKTDTNEYRTSTQLRYLPSQQERSRRAPQTACSSPPPTGSTPAGSRSRTQ